MPASANLTFPALLGVILVLAGCGSEQDRAAAPLPAALEAFGLTGVTYARAVKDGDTVSLLDVKAQVDGREARASEVAFKGFKATATSWSADRVTAERVTGAVSAERAVVVEPRASRESGAWSVTRSGAYADGTVRGRILGTDVEARHLGAAKSENQSRPGLALDADGARMNQGEAWDLRATLRTDLPGKLILDVSKAVSPTASLGPFLLVLDATPEGAAALSALDANALLDPSRWPRGVALRSLEADLTLASRPGWFPAPESTQDPAVSSLLKAIGAALVPSAGDGRKGSGLRIAMAPPRPVPVRDLAKVFAGSDATAVLGLSVTGPSIPRGNAVGQPFTMGAGTPGGSVPPFPAR